MKLYTENQVKKMLEVCRDSDLYEHILTFEDILKTETPIELPSDEEIEKAKDTHQLGGYEWQNEKRKSFKIGVLWTRDKIQGGNNENNSRI